MRPWYESATGEGLCRLDSIENNRIHHVINLHHIHLFVLGLVTGTLSEDGTKIDAYMIEEVSASDYDISIVAAEITATDYMGNTLQYKVIENFEMVSVFAASDELQTWL